MSKKNKNSKLNLKHLLDDDSDIEDNLDVNWDTKSATESDERKNKKKTDDDDDDGDDGDDGDDDEYNTYNDDEEIIDSPKKSFKEKKPAEPEINIDTKKGDDNEKCVQITIKMALENKTKDIITIDFTINKKTFLKIAKELK